MKYFEINYEERLFSLKALRAAFKADPVTHHAMMQIIDIQCRADGYQPCRIYNEFDEDENYVDTFLEILPATKAFLKSTTQPNKTARRVMAQIEAIENA